MKRLCAAIVVAQAMIAATGTAQADELFKATLTGDQEVPPVDTVASGMAFFRLDVLESTIEIQLHVNQGAKITQSHIHCAAEGVNGPIIVFLAGLHAAGLDVDGKWISSATFDDLSIVNNACGATVAEIADSMRLSETYVNVHSIAVPSGEIRGQVLPTRSTP